jgi:hypothetical protein
MSNKGGSLKKKGKQNMEGVRRPANLRPPATSVPARCASRGAIQIAASSRCGRRRRHLEPPRRVPILSLLPPRAASAGCAVFPLTARLNRDSPGAPGPAPSPNSPASPERSVLVTRCPTVRTATFNVFPHCLSCWAASPPHEDCSMQCAAWLSGSWAHQRRLLQQPRQGY